MKIDQNLILKIEGREKNQSTSPRKRWEAKAYKEMISSRGLRYITTPFHNSMQPKTSNLDMVFPQRLFQN